MIPRFTTGGDLAVFALLSGWPSLGSGRGWITGREGTRGTSPAGHFPRWCPRTYQDGAWEILKPGDVGLYEIATGGLDQQFIAEPCRLAAVDRRVLITPGGRPQLAPDHPVIVYRFTTKADNSRTLIASALKHGYLPHASQVNTISTDQAPLEDVLALLGVLNSPVTDWWIRRLADRHISPAMIGGVRLPDWSPEQRAGIAARVRELLLRNGVTELPGGIRLDGQPRPHEDKTDTQLLAEIDAALLAGFRLGPEHLATILADFRTSEGAVSDDYRQRLWNLVTGGPYGRPLVPALVPVSRRRLYPASSDAGYLYPAAIRPRPPW